MTAGSDPHPDWPETEGAIRPIHFSETVASEEPDAASPVKSATS
jgi:hypothetical protein